MKPIIDINKGIISYRAIILYPKMKILEQNYPLQKESVNNDLTEYTLQTYDDYFLQIFLKNEILDSVLIEYIGDSKNWEEYMQIEKLRKQKIEEILLENNVTKDKNNEFNWGKIECIYDPKNVSYFASIKYS